MICEMATLITRTLSTKIALSFGRYLLCQPFEDKEQMKDIIQEEYEKISMNTLHVVAELKKKSNL